MTSKNANWLFLTTILTHIGVVLFLSIFGGFIHIGIVANFFLSQSILMVPALLFLLCTRRKPAPNGYAAPQQSMPNGYAAQQQYMPNGYAAQQQYMPNGYVAPQQFMPNGYATPQQYMPNGYAVPQQPARTLGFRRIRISSILMIALCTFLVMPFVTVLNALSMFFTDNAMAAIEGDIVSVPFPVMLFMIGIFGPFCEEFVFRGIIYGSYAGRGETSGNAGYPRQSGGIGAVLLSALTFGLMHMNFNQAIYAFAIGILLALLVEAAGSLWASVFCHMFFNSVQVVLMYLSKAILGSDYENAMKETAKELTSTDLQAVIAVYLVIAAVTVPIAACCVAWIAKNEGRQEAMRALFGRSNGRAAAQPPQNRPQNPSQQLPPGRPQNPSQQMPPGRLQNPSPQLPMGGQQNPQPSEPLLSVPLVVAIVLCLGFMSLELFL